MKADSKTAGHTATKNATRFWSQRDDEGHCTRCGLYIEDKTVSTERHECPPGFWKDLRPSKPSSELVAQQHGTLIIIRKRVVAQLMEPSPSTATKPLDLGSPKWDEGMGYAREIVTAVNSHASNLRKVEALREALRGLIPLVKEDCHTMSNRLHDKLVAAERALAEEQL